MKRTILIIALGTLPTFVMASPEQILEQQPGIHDMNDMLHNSYNYAAGRPGDPTKVSRTIKVTMDDTMQFSPDQLKFNVGEVVRFVVRNAGKIRHEMVIGSMDELKEHAGMMRTTPAMQHAKPNIIGVIPGESGELVWQFDKPGRFDFACLVPGHLEAGMAGKIDIE